jgi:oxygen-independent coproporphyrinogen-3 oxidase
MKISNVSHNAGLYIHIPFCRSKCSYCNFYSTTALDGIDDFTKALMAEMNLYKTSLSHFDTLYIGGGTPSLLTVKHVSDILTHIRETFSIMNNSEITIEINPADVNFHELQLLHQMGINRISIGIQSFDDNILAFLGRRHTGCQARNIITDTRQAGFDNIGLDLMYGIPGQDPSSWKDTLREALSFEVEHLSCYQLDIEGNTPLGKCYRRGEFHLPDDDEQYDIFMITSSLLEDAGYIHYEVSNFARNRAFISKHNSKYWNHSQYLGLGPAAHSFAGNRRWWNKCSLTAYLEDIQKGKAPVAALEGLSREELCFEALFLGLRTMEGIHLQNFHKVFEYDLLSEKAQMIQMLEESGLIRTEDGYLRPTRAGLAVADSLSLI